MAHYNFGSFAAFLAIIGHLWCTKVCGDEVDDRGQSMFEKST
jgi:hypothetical protein